MRRILLSIGATLISVFPMIASAEGQQPPAVSAANAPLNAEIERLLREGGQRLPTGIEREELAAFYAGRNYAPLWVTQGHARPEAQRLIEVLKTAGQDGLDPAAYPVDALQSGMSQGGVNAAALAAWDISMSNTLGIYTIDLRRGRTKPTIDFTDPSLRPPDLRIRDVLARGAQAPSLAAFIDALDNMNPIYSRFRDALARYRMRGDTVPFTLDGHPFLRRGDRSPTIAALHEYLDVQPEPDGPETFGAALEEAVRNFQRSRALKDDGILGPQTVEFLNQSRADRIPTILANMERARWLPHNMGARFLLVDIPGFELKLFEQGKELSTMRIIVGKEYQRTPMFADTMEFVVVNPYWNLPDSILRKEIAPAVRRNGIGYLRRNNMEVLSGWGDGARVIPASSVNWAAAAAGASGIRVRQKPGPDNALGRIKFMFPNKYAIYIHDTPTGHLFERAKRAFSHGCIRAERPLELAAFVFQGSPEWDVARIEQAINTGKPQTINLPAKVPVYVTYFTAWPREDGTMTFREDIYGRDGALKAQLAGK